MIEEKLKSLNITLPSPPKPAGAYIPVVKSVNTAYVSGQIPIEDGKVAFKGSELGSLDKISKILRVSGFVNSDPDFTEQPKVINAASDLLFEIFGEKGQHSRIAVGVASLPLGATVEIDMVVEIN